jgi:hypothetical protein
MQKQLDNGPLKKLSDFRKLQSQNLFHKNLSFGPNIIPHNFHMGPMLWNWDTA